MSELKPCPFCGGDAERTEWRERGAYDGHYSPQTFIRIRCTVCGAKSGDGVKQNMIDITEYKVEDFRNNPALRAAEEDRLAVVVRDSSKAVDDLWNARIAVEVSDE